MTTELALANIRTRMRDKGYDEQDYSVGYKHFVIPGSGRLEVTAYNEIYYLEHEPEDVNIRSEFGLFDLSFTASNEMKYEHTGLISIRNYSAMPGHVRFIHVTLRHQIKKHHG